MESDDIRDMGSRILVVSGIEFSLPLARIFQVGWDAGFGGWALVFGGVMGVFGVAVLYAGESVRKLG